MCSSLVVSLSASEIATNRPNGIRTYTLLGIYIVTYNLIDVFVDRYTKAIVRYVSIGSPVFF